MCRSNTNTNSLPRHINYSLSQIPSQSLSIPVHSPLKPYSIYVHQPPSPPQRIKPSPSRIEEIKVAKTIKVPIRPLTPSNLFQRLSPGYRSSVSRECPQSLRGVNNNPRCRPFSHEIRLDPGAPGPSSCIILHLQSTSLGAPVSVRVNFP